MGLTSPSVPFPEFSGVLDVDAEVIDVVAQAEGRAERARPLHLALRVDAHHGLPDLVLARRGEPPLRGRVIEADGGEPVASDLHAHGALGMAIEEVAEPAVRDRPPATKRSLGLLELVAVLRVVEEVGEVREERQLVPHHVRRGPRGDVGAAGALRSAVPGSGVRAWPPVGWIDGAETRDQARVDGAIGHWSVDRQSAQ